MSNFTDRIKPTDKGITTYLDDLQSQNYQIPTFQREVVWEKENVKKLWDSIYKFYPLGSILIWKTSLKLQNHRKVGGHKIADDNFSRTEYQYILDGQQRTTSLLTSLYGGSIEGRPDFQPTLYVDLSVINQEDTDDESYRSRFLFWEEIDDREGEYKANSGKKKKYDEGVIVKLIDIKQSFGTIESRLQKNSKYQDYENEVRIELRRMKEVLDNYRLSFIELKGIQVAEVCQIFERINQAGKPLNIFDIVVAKTFRPEKRTKVFDEENKQEKEVVEKGFYLRELIEEFQNSNNSKFLQIDDLTYLQILATLIKNYIPNSGIWNITDRYLNEIRTEQLEAVWGKAKTAMLKMFDFFENHIGIKSPQLIPFRYFYLSITAYFYENRSPDYQFLRRYFWFHSFHNDDLLSNTTQLNQHIWFLLEEAKGNKQNFGDFYINRETLRTASYSSRGRISRAILSLFAHCQPKDWKFTDRNVLVENFFFTTDRPNLHHIFPTNSAYVLDNRHNNKIDSNSLMNIAYLTQITNLEISNKNPLDYIKEYHTPEFERIIATHLLPKNILDWSKMEEMPLNSLDTFIDERINLIVEKLKELIPNFNIYDTREMAEQNAPSVQNLENE
ncbi:MAG: hypothetical protein EPGJADBJ_04886 [Saprospiraceae bacterium]|nr:hypothetical protein [Saprospiraceae bacterium]